MGDDDELVASGSDDGRVFIYCARTGDLVRCEPALAFLPTRARRAFGWLMLETTPCRVLDADADVANCVQPHPRLPVLATSGIEKVIRTWAPVPEPDFRCLDDLVSSSIMHCRLPVCWIVRTMPLGLRRHASTWTPSVRGIRSRRRQGLRPYGAWTRDSCRS